MTRRLGIWLYPIAFAVGVGFAVLAWLVAGALGDSSWSAMVDWAVGLIAGAFAFSLLTGINLGLPRSIRSLDGSDGSLVSARGGLALLCFAVAVLFVGPVVTALFQ
jgi:hypothetical protein